MSRNDDLTTSFTRLFGGMPDLIARAPGRVNLLGEHTDYNDGFVLPMAINMDIRIATRMRSDRRVYIYSTEFDQRDVFGLAKVERANHTWANYVRGVAEVLQCEGYALRGMDAAISSNVPRGTGLSSSAALELAAATAFRLLCGLDLAPLRAALLCQRAENEFVGVRCGAMDQLISSLGQADHALLIDCRGLEHRPVPLPADVCIVVVDSAMRRDLLASAYNERRGECEAGASFMDVPALRDASAEVFGAYRNAMPTTVARRCWHVITENQRVLDGAVALERGDVAAFGRLMNASHASLRDFFEVTTPEIDTLVSIQQATHGCLGARLTGAGFGGCTVALVQRDAVPAFLEAVHTRYPAATGKIPQAYVCHAADGASVASDT
ncbi:MAG: galactokinase [Chloroflexi bacterium]|nr:galactokinase [Chloroflexota bacterium]